jgi:hypothetical protein
LGERAAWRWAGAIIAVVGATGGRVGAVCRIAGVVRPARARGGCPDRGAI